MEIIKDVSGCPYYICMHCVEMGCPEEVSKCVECPYYSGCKDCAMPICDRRVDY